MMYRNVRITLLTLVAVASMAACGKEEAPAADTDADTAIEEDVVEPAAGDAADIVDAATDEAVEVVEESAAEVVDDDAEIKLAQAETPAAAVSYRYVEGTHYQRLVPSQPTIGGADKIEVAEFFWYGCPHCYDLEPTINRWAEDVPPNVRFVRVPAMWNEVLQLHARVFYTAQILVRNGVIPDGEAFRRAVFDEYHNRNNRLLNEPSIRRLFGRFGVSDGDFDKAWSSFEVAQKLRVAADLARRYSISGVPAIVVNGKYRTGAGEAGSYQKLIEVIDELIARESAR